MPHPQTEHVIVLMLENRSFDHMFGFLDHQSNFEGLQNGFSNPDNNGIEIPATPTAGFEVPHDPSHRHFSVMYQLTETNPSGNPPHYKRPYRINNRGFVKEYERHAPGKGAEIMKCQPPGNIPVLATLAKSFALCDHWFSSLPGMTWPNRFFAHAASSSATVNNYKALYGMRTIFHALSRANKTWLVFHHGDAHARTMPVTWRRVRRMQDFYDRVAGVGGAALPQYSFIEPNHLGDPAVTNSQHPGQNETNTGGADFKAGELLIRDIYRALIGNEAVWRKSLLLITYDEHGGFFDHVPPPDAVPPDPRLSPELFGFDLLGVRVPAVIVSPYIPAATIDATIYDHSSIVASVREQFEITKPLTNRDRNANTFWRNLTLQQPRLGASIPTLEGPQFAELESARTAESFNVAGEAPPDEDDFDMVWIAQQLDRVTQAEEAAQLEALPAAIETMAAPAQASFDTLRDVGAYAQEINARFIPPQEIFEVEEEK